MKVLALTVDKSLWKRSRTDSATIAALNLRRMGRASSFGSPLISPTGSLWAMPFSMHQNGCASTASYLDPQCYSVSTGVYSLWMNRLPRAEPIVEAYRSAGFCVGTSQSPEGPLTFPQDVLEATPIMAHAGGADFSLLQDGNRAFIAYGSWHNFKIKDGWRARVFPEWARQGHQIAVQRFRSSDFLYNCSTL